MALRLLYLIFGQLVVWLGLLARSSLGRRMRKSWCCAMKSLCWSPGAPAATVVGGSGGVRGADPMIVPGLPTASDRHPRHGIAAAPGPGDPALDPAPTAPHRRPLHGTRAAPI